MLEIKHPAREEIEDYIWEELSEERGIEISEHLSVCKECQRLSQKEFRAKLILESWTAKAHGEAYWKTRLSGVLEDALELAKTQGLKKRIKEWIEESQGKFGGAVQIVLGSIKEMGEVLTHFPRQFLAPQAIQFAQAAVIRGTEKEPGVIKVISKDKPGIQVLTDLVNRKVVVQIEESQKKPPLVILSPKEGKPLLTEPKKVEGTNFYAAIFENIPAGEYVLIFEPKK
jgi:hypothetical protein